MTGSQWSSPFGAKPISAAQILAEQSLRRRQDALRHARRTGEGGDSDAATADKWQVLRALSQGAAAFGLSDRAVCVLEALLSFRAGRELDGAAPAIVFPSNRELSARARGMAPATLRRHLAALVAAGLILRRDSPNGKRYRRFDESGEGEAYGFDLSPLALRADAILAAAAEETRKAREAARLRSAASLHRRDIRKILEAALAEGREGRWTEWAARLAALSRTAGRGASLPEIAATQADLLALRHAVENAYLASLSDEELSANDAQNERHHQNSKPDSPFESQGSEKGKEAETAARYEGPPGEGSGSEALVWAPERKGAGLDVGTVLAACPDMADHAPRGIRSFADLVEVADRVRGYLGISADAFARARRAMGDEQAAMVVAAILQRDARIRSPGGYLRSLTERAQKGAFRVEPMLRALWSQSDPGAGPAPRVPGFEAPRTGSWP